MNFKHFLIKKCQIIIKQKKTFTGIAIEMRYQECTGIDNRAETLQMYMRKAIKCNSSKNIHDDKSIDKRQQGEVFY